MLLSPESIQWILFTDWDDTFPVINNRDSSNVAFFPIILIKKQL